MPGHASLPLLGARASIGGLLMGLANLVPGISGGTMLLATGVYTQFVGAVAEVTTARFRARSLLVLGCIGAAALVAIAGLAGVVKGLVADHRWVMYSLFLGLTLGGVPVVWRMARRVSPALVAGTCLGIGVMVWTALTSAGGAGDSGFLILFAAGLAGASAMILPGVSGAYLLLVLGQYETILGAVDGLKHGAVGASLRVVVPVAIGVLLGIAAVSNLIRWMLARHARFTYGLLLGLLLGSVLGIYPFQQAKAPGSAELAHFMPAASQLVASLALAALGFAATTLIDRLGSTS